MNEYAPGSRWELGPDGMLRRRVLTDQNGVPLEQRLCAACPWVKIEPGCEMPEVEGLYLVIDCGPRVAHWDGELWWSGDGIINPTHYAVLRMPEKVNVKQEANDD